MKDLLDYINVSSVHIYRHNLAKFNNFQRNLSRCGDSLDFQCLDMDHENIYEKRRYRCMNRICMKVGCLRKRRKRLYDVLSRSIVNMRNLKFITLTYADRHGLSRDIKEQLDSYFKEFIRNIRRKKLLLGGYIKVLEITKNPQGFYYHFHIVIEMKYFDQKKLSKLWKRITGTSYIVHIKPVTDRSHAVSYVAKYLVKGIHSNISNVAWYNEFYGLKMYSIVGVHRNKKTRQKSIFDEYPFIIAKYPEEYVEELTEDDILDLFELVT